MICFSLKGVDDIYCKFLAETRPENAIEIRLDSCRLEQEQIKEIFSTERGSYLIATYRPELPSQIEAAVESLTNAILSGADYVDIDRDFPQGAKEWLIKLAMNKGCKVILSYHNFKNTEETSSLRRFVDEARIMGADIVKVVTTANGSEDEEKVLDLYNYYDPSTLIAFTMGEKGVDSRLESYYKGAPLFYLAPRRGVETAAGQPCYFDFVRDESILLRGTPAIPASKSFAQRAILLASLAEGTTKLYKLTICNDIEAALNVAAQLGADIEIDGDTLTITGHQNIRRKGLIIKDNTLHVGESGLMARLCIPLAGLSNEPVTITGEKTLLKRKMGENKTALRKFGLKVEFTDGVRLPATVSGGLRGAEVELSGAGGSQLISGLLIALTQCPRESVLKVKKVTSAPYLNLTTYLMSFFGMEEPFFPEDEEDDERTYLIDVGRDFKPLHGIEIEKDWSTAALFMAAGAIMGDITIEKMDLFSNQADAMIYDFLEQCNVDMVKNEDGSLNVRKSIICPFFFDLTDAPDLFAPLLLMSIRADGESCITGIKRLHNKESNRVATFVEEFSKLGVHFTIDGNNLFIEGEDGKILSGADCSSHGDHRLAMALSFASLIAKGKVTIDDTECTAKSFPGFIETLNKLKTK